MSHCFRLRFDLHGMMRIGSDRQEYVLSESGAERVTLQATEPDQHNGENASSVVVVGCGYGSADAARDVGLGWAAVFQRAFASLNIGADLGGRRTSDGWTARLREAQRSDNEDQQQAEELIAGMKLLYDQPGLLLFEDDPWPTFARRTSFGFVGQSPSVLADVVAAVQRADAPLSAMEQTAYELYSSSFSVVSSDARFIVLMMALETLIDPQPRGAAVVAHVNALIEQTRQSDVPENEISSLVGSLTYMRHESIGQAGRRLAQALGSQQYMNLAADRFFTRAIPSEAASCMASIRVRSARRSIATRSVSSDLLPICSRGHSMIPSRPYEPAMNTAERAYAIPTERVTPGTASSVALPPPPTASLRDPRCRFGVLPL